MTALLTLASARRLPLHERIVWARKRKGISQERLAERIGTSRRHMIRIEKGLHRPGPEFRARIADATEQPPEFFSDDDDEESSPMPLSAAEFDLLGDLMKRLGPTLASRPLVEAGSSNPRVALTVLEASDAAWDGAPASTNGGAQ